MDRFVIKTNTIVDQAAAFAEEKAELDVVTCRKQAGYDTDPLVVTQQRLMSINAEIEKSPDKNRLSLLIEIRRQREEYLFAGIRRLTRQRNTLRAMSPRSTLVH